MWCGGSFCLPPLFVQKCKKTEKKAEYVAWKPKNINKSKRGKEFFEAKRNFFACQFCKLDTSLYPPWLSYPPRVCVCHKKMVYLLS
jgi:hypothetical protein